MKLNLLNFLLTYKKGIVIIPAIRNEIPKRRDGKEI